MRQRVFFILASVFLFLALLLYIHERHLKGKSAYIKENLGILSQQIDATIENLRNFSQYAHEQVVDRSEVTGLMEEAWHALEAERSVIRKRLYDLLQPEYEHLLRFKFRQLHFVFPDNRSFLRMHAPEDFGDDLSQTRATIRVVNETHKPVSGFEEGRIFNGYRFVYPVFHKQLYYGAVEVSFSMASFLDVLARLSPQRLRFAIRRSVVESAVFKHQQKNYKECPIAPTFLYDRGCHSLQNEQDEMLFAATGTHLAGRMETGEDFGLVVRHGHRDWMVLFKAIKNFSGDHVAYIISANMDTEYRRMNNAHLLTMGVLLIIFLAFQIFSILFIAERQKLKILSNTDTLTRLPNRNRFIQSGKIEMERARRYRSPLSLLIVDIDNFKSINDTFGHNEGDTVLRNTASVLRSTMRSMDMAARWGGEEFIILLPQTDLDGAVAVGARFCSVMATSLITPHRTVTVSIGATEYVPGESLEDFIGRADTALYRAKHSGKNRVECEAVP